jgi:7,8-dihydropterin-6-yl-methyl-4-(beta-D-ribofuranosyl)aminobenzene 5'-phosphate synthase
MEVMKHSLSVTVVFIITAVILSSWAVPAWCYGGSEGREDMMIERKGSRGIPLEGLRLTVTYDNNPYDQRLKTAWGFSCLVEGAEKVILFDTGGEAPVLLANMDSLGVKLEDIDIVVLSHNHDDHTGGLMDLLARNRDVKVYLPKSFPAAFKERVTQAGAEVVEVKDPVEVCKDVYSVGEMGGWIKEQSLAVRTDEGLVVITGCAHPGIVPIVEKARELFEDDVLLAMGGFHLLRTGAGEVEDVINDLKDLGVAYAGPCHCSGDGARHLFKEKYGAKYVEIGVGTVLAGRSLK